jgi:hypothetical protein
MKYRIKKDSRFIDNETVYWIQKKRNMFSPWTYISESGCAILFHDEMSAGSYIHELIYKDKHEDTTLEKALIVSAALLIVSILTVIYNLR